MYVNVSTYNSDSFAVGGLMYVNFSTIVTHLLLVTHVCKLQINNFYPDFSHTFALQFLSVYDKKKLEKTCLVYTKYKGICNTGREY